MCELIQTEGFHLTQESLPLRVMGVLASMSEYRVLLLLFLVESSSVASGSCHVSFPAIR